MSKESLNQLGAFRITSIIQPLTLHEKPASTKDHHGEIKREPRVIKREFSNESIVTALVQEMGPTCVVSRRRTLIGKKRFVSIKLDSIEWIVWEDYLEFQAPAIIGCGLDVYPITADKAVQTHRWYLATDKAKVKALLHDLFWPLIGNDEAECGNYYPERCDPWQIDESGRLSRQENGVRYWFDWKDDLFILSDSQGHISTYKDPGEAVEAYGKLTIHHSGSPSS